MRIPVPQFDRVIATIPMKDLKAMQKRARTVRPKAARTTNGKVSALKWIRSELKRQDYIRSYICFFTREVEKRLNGFVDKNDGSAKPLHLA